MISTIWWKSEKKEIKKEHVERVYRLFANVKRSVDYLRKMEEEMIYG